MDALINEGCTLGARLLDQSVVQCKPCLSLKYGDIYLGRYTSTTTSTAGEELLAAYKRYDGSTFTGARLNPQGQVCLSLNRPITFQRCIQQILEGRLDWGGCHGDTTFQGPIIVTDYFIGYHVPGNEPGLPGSSPCWQQLSVSEGRIILIKKLICHILTVTGHHARESQLTNECSAAGEAESDDTRPPSTDLLVQKFFNSFPASPFTLSPTSTSEADFLRGIESSTYLSHSTAGAVCDAKRFLQEKGLLGYDGNINTIRVSGEDGSLTPVGSLAHNLSQLHTREKRAAAKKVVHVTCHGDSFRLQQALVLAQISAGSNSRLNPSPPQHNIILCSGVEVLEGGRARKDYPLAKLLKKRQGQMRQAFHVKYDTETISAGEVQEMVSATTEAVLKFELLSTDPQSKVKLTIPDETGQSSDVRFAGSFVLYNYARLANLVRNFEKACSLGTYPSLPDISSIDFSLLTDEEEWSILFHYLLQFPVIARELVTGISQCQTLRCHTKLKKICQFLSQLSHCVSTYYSRVKVLMAPEPHLLPLIHARLLLVKAIKQTMYSGLQLLAIEPLDQL